MVVPLQAGLEVSERDGATPSGVKVQEGVRHVAAPVAQVGGVSKRNDDGTTQSTLRALNLGLDGTLHLALPLCLGEMLAVGLWDRNPETIQNVVST